MTHSRNFRLIVVACFAIVGLAMGCQPEKDAEAGNEPSKESPPAKPGRTGENTFLVIEVEPAHDTDGKPVPQSEVAVGEAAVSVAERLATIGHFDHVMEVLGDGRFSLEMPRLDPAEREDIRSAIERTAKLELKQVHMQSASLAPRIASGEEIAPPGYKIYTFPILDEDGKKIGEQPNLLSRRNIIGGNVVETAAPVPGQYGKLDVLLTPQGGKRVANATEKMRMGVDRMAIVLNGKGIIAPVVQAKLGRRFVISGLGGKEEVDQIVLALNVPLRNSLKIISEQDLPDSDGKEEDPKK